ncbi:MAG: glycosyltransferase family 9 protein [Candidatus Delongbacteria bacterium]|nr:glycosyltransferase family 9 protein [Candidatus Delongbacteria bacterium]MBN2834247.1 glycosyltransferase family 9 protein [Candidatus Delongbacteria bacterium]
MDIAVVNILRIGDILQTVPLLKILSKNNNLTLVCDNIGIDFLSDIIPNITFLKIDIKVSLRLSLSSSLFDFMKLFSQNEFDLVYNLNSNELSYFISQYLGKKIIGPIYELGGIVNDLRFDFLFRTSDDRSIFPINLSDLYLSYCRDQNYKAQEDSEKNGYVVLNIDTGAEVRNLPIDFLKQLTEVLSKKFPVYLTGLDQDKGDKISADLSSVINYAGRTSYYELAELVRKSSLVISADTSTIHLAAIYNKNIIGLYNVSAYIYQTAPISGKFYGFHTKRSCYPCSEEFQPCGNLACMKDFDVDRISKAACDILNNSENIDCDFSTKMDNDAGLLIVNGDKELKNINLIIKFLLYKNSNIINFVDQYSEFWNNIIFLLRNMSFLSVNELLQYSKQNKKLNRIFEIFLSH